MCAYTRAADQSAAEIAAVTIDGVQLELKLRHQRARALVARAQFDRFGEARPYTCTEQNKNNRGTAITMDVTQNKGKYVFFFSFKYTFLNDNLAVIYSYILVRTMYIINGD